MDAEMWMNANKTLEPGFCDEIMAAWYSPSKPVWRSGKMHRGKRFGEILKRFRENTFRQIVQNNLAKCSGGVKWTGADSDFGRLRRIFDTTKRCPNHTIPRNPPGNPLSQALSAPMG